MAIKTVSEQTQIKLLSHTTDTNEYENLGRSPSTFSEFDNFFAASLNQFYPVWVCWTMFFPLIHSHFKR